MAIVTFKITDLTGSALPTGTLPEATFTPSEPEITIDGTVISTYPVKFKPDSAGNVTANLLTTDGVAEHGFHYKLQVRWSNPAGYQTAGFTTVDFPDWKIRVPPAGGNLADLIDRPHLPARDEALWVGPSAPPNGFVRWFDTSGTYVVYKEWVA